MVALPMPIFSNILSSSPTGTWMSTLSTGSLKLSNAVQRGASRLCHPRRPNHQTRSARPLARGIPNTLLSDHTHTRISHITSGTFQESMNG